MSSLQNNAQWHEARKGKISASRIGSILGVDKRRSRDELLRQMVRDWHGIETEFTPFVQEILEHGKRTEPIAIAAIQAERGEFIDDAGFIQHPEIDFLGCSPDGLIGDYAGVEVKCPTKQRKDLMDVIHDPGYRCQCLMSLIVTGRTYWHFYVYRDGELLHTVYSLQEAEAWFEGVIDELTDFNETFQAIIASEDLSSPFLADSEVHRNDDEWMELTLLYRLAQTKLDEAKANLDRQKAALIDGADGKKTKGNGVTVYPVKPRKSTNYRKACVDAGLDLNPYKSISGSEYQWQVRINKES